MKYCPMCFSIYINDSHLVCERCVIELKDMTITDDELLESGVITTPDFVKTQLTSLKIMYEEAVEMAERSEALAKERRELAEQKKWMLVNYWKLITGVFDGSKYTETSQ